METSTIQTSLFDTIKLKLSSNQTLPKAIAECLNVSIDAAYKKINGQRNIDMQEFELLLKHFNIGLSDLNSPVETSKVWLDFNPINSNGFTYINYLQKMKGNLTALIQQNVKSIIYSAKEVPMFYNFMFPELGCFKSYVWQKSILQLSNFKSEQFSIGDLDGEIIELGREIFELYLSIPSKEIWNYETVNCTLRQIEFYKTSKLFANKESQETILNQYKTLIKHIEKQTACGHKLTSTHHEKATFDLYHNELILGDNSVLVNFENGHRLAFITPNAVNTFNSSHPKVTVYLDTILNNILKKSVRLNKQSEKFQAPFFDYVFSTFDSKLEPS
jgi:hypothetical protein